MLSFGHLQAFPKLHVSSFEACLALQTSRAMLIITLTDTMTNVLHLTTTTVHQIVHHDPLSAPIAIEPIDRLRVAPALRLNMLLIHMLQGLEVAVHEVALHDAVPEVLSQEGDSKEVDIVADQGLLHPEPFLRDEIAMSDHPPEPAVTPGLRPPELVPLRQ